VALCLYRVAQEGLRNVSKHAHAGRAAVTLARAPGVIVLSIKDSGVGFEVAAARGKGGLGIVSMEERVRLAGGELTVDSRPGGGVRIAVRIPLPESP
jgi:signal transduction histidine kinase